MKSGSRQTGRGTSMQAGQGSVDQSRANTVRVLNSSYGLTEYDYVDNDGISQRVEVFKMYGTPYWGWQLDASTGGEMFSTKRDATENMLVTLNVEKQS